MARSKKNGKKPIEQYEHKGKERLNNPPVGLVTPDTDRDTGRKKYAYDPHLDPQLQWAGKAEHTAFEVPTVSLHVHERIDPRTIIQTVKKKNGGPQLSLFETREENPPLRDAIDFYKHKHNWSNRLIAGDSLLVMNSLLEKEGMGAQVQMVYMDPPYGIKYGSNFQPFVNKRDVKDGKDEDLTAEPEMIKAFRDTWELGIHSYLTYLRDRLLLAKEMLHESGSCFVQISDENVHLVRNLMDEVFGVGNFCGLITFQKTGSVASKLIGSTIDFLLWYANNKEQVKYRQLYLPRQKGNPSLDRYDQIELQDSSNRRLTKEEILGNKPEPPNSRRFRVQSLFSDGETQSQAVDFEYNGKVYRPTSGSHWKTNLEGLTRLAKAGRLVIEGKRLRYKRYMDDFPVIPLNDRWESIQIGTERLYVVQTAATAIQRCLLMTTDPGDIVFDPTCGSGTTAYVAEQWGRRWITCDTSRVATTLAKQRLMTALFDYYELAHPGEGVGSGFKYKTVPHITLKSIANNEPAAQETLYDQPFLDKSRTRVTGPFTVEAVPAPMVKPIHEIGPLANLSSQEEGFMEVKFIQNGESPDFGKFEIGDIRKLSDNIAKVLIERKVAEKAPPLDVMPFDNSIARSGETLRQEEWRAELLRAGIRGKGGQSIDFSRVEPLAGTRWLHADAETKGERPERVVVSFGPEHSPLEQRQVALALEEAQTLIPKPKIVVFASFQFDPEAAKDIDELNWPGVTLLKAQMNADMLTDDLKKKRASNESFWLIGQPEIRVEKIKSGEDKGRYRVEVMGFDYYNTKNGTIDSGGTEKIAMWMLDTDYDGRSLMPRQVFFPMSGEKDGWSRLAKNLKAEIDEELIEAYRGTISLPFEAGENKRVAVKIVDDRGIESLKIIGVE